MARFLIEVPHEATTLACARAVEAFLRSGSHFLVRADWGCRDGEHKAWLIVEVDTRDEARNLIPSFQRAQARIVRLGTFKLKDIEETIRRHEA
jgi:hypothetical protein